MLELEQLFFFLKIINNLLETLFKNENLLFQDLDLFLLLDSPLLILIIGFLLEHHVSMLLLVVAVLLGFLPLVVVEGVPLAHRLLGQLLVLVVDVAFYLLDVPLGVLGGLGLELLE